jgi:hypothetical protein
MGTYYSQSVPGGAPAEVPEPASMALLTVAAPLILRRRRRG